MSYKNTKFKNKAIKYIALLGLTSLLTDISSEMIMPIFPMYIVALGGTGVVIGLIGGLSQSIASLLKVFSGYISDRSKSRKKLVFVGYLTSAVSKLFFPAATSWWQLLILKPLERVGKGIRTAPRDAMIAAYTKIKNRGKGFGIHRAMDTSGAVIGSVLALLFIYFNFNFRFVLAIAAVVAFFGLLPLYFVKEKRFEKTKTNIKVTLENLPKNLKQFIIISMIFYLANFSYMFFILRVQDFYEHKFALLIPIALYVLYNIVYALFSIPVGKLSDKIGRKKTLLIGYLFFTLTSLGFVFSNSIYFFILLFSTYGISFAFVEVTQRAYVSDLSRKSRGTALGAFHTAVGIAALPGSFIAGCLWQYVGHGATFIYGFILGALALMLLFLWNRKQ